MAVGRRQDATAEGNGGRGQALQTPASRALRSAHTSSGGCISTAQMFRVASAPSEVHVEDGARSRVSADRRTQSGQSGPDEFALAPAGGRRSRRQRQIRPARAARGYSEAELKRFSGHLSLRSRGLHRPQPRTAKRKACTWEWPSRARVVTEAGWSWPVTSLTRYARAASPGWQPHSSLILSGALIVGSGVAAVAAG